MWEFVQPPSILLAGVLDRLSRVVIWWLLWFVRYRYNDDIKMKLFVIAVSVASATTLISHSSRDLEVSFCVTRTVNPRAPHKRKSRRSHRDSTLVWIYCREFASSSGMAQRLIGALHVAIRQSCIMGLKTFSPPAKTVKLSNQLDSATI